MRKFGSLKTILLTISLSLSACGSLIPEPPAVWQCQYNGSPRAFYCVNIKTKQRLKVPASDPSMKAAQCLSADDYAAMENWIKIVKQIAERHCR